jgi:hypothetical protein
MVCVESVHATLQLLLTQWEAAPTTVVLHVFVHVPQLESSLRRSTQTLLQIESFVGHDCPQDVPSQVAVPPLGAVHLVQVEPQALTSLATHLPPQRCVPPVHWQTPAMHCWVSTQALPHFPQFVVSVLKSTQLPGHVFG